MQEAHMQGAAQYPEPTSGQQPADAVEKQSDANEAIIIQEMLAMNTLAMQRCDAEALTEASSILTDAYMKLHNGTAVGASKGLDAIRATTLNNLGVVECHRGHHRQALSRFEAARQLEEAWNEASPSVALNSCAAYNALGMYDKATAAAMETISMLRRLFTQEASALYPTNTPAPLSLGDGMSIARSENAALWGAAWHNLAVAQINTAKSSTNLSEYTNAAALFHNAMRATQELLGYNHPMTKNVTETYRAVRSALRTHGVYKQHHTLFTAPSRPVDPRDEADDVEQYLKHCGIKSKRRALQKYHQDLTITFCGNVTNGVKLTERLDPKPYPNARDVVFRGGGTKDTSRMLRIMPMGSTIEKACQLYGNPHPLLFSLPPSYLTDECRDPKSSRRHDLANCFSKAAMRPPRLESPRRPRPPKRQKVLSSEKQSQPYLQRYTPRQIQPRYVQHGNTVNYLPTIPTSTREHVNTFPSDVPSYERINNVHEQPMPQQRAPVVSASQWWSPFDQGEPSMSSGGPVQCVPDVPQEVPGARPWGIAVPPRAPVEPPRNSVEPPRSSAEPSRSSAERSRSSAEPSQSAHQSVKKVAPHYYHQQPSARGQASNDGHSSAPQDVDSNFRMASMRSEPKTRRMEAEHGPSAAALSFTPAVEGSNTTRKASSQGALPPLRKASFQNRATVASGGKHTDDRGRPGETRCALPEKQPPVRDARREYEQMRYILLAEPPTEQRRKSVGMSRRSSVQKALPTPDDRPDTGLPTPGVEECTTEMKPHRLFDAMWVAATSPREEVPTRVVGKPSYFVSSVIDVRKDQVILPEEVVQMIVDSSNSSGSELEMGHSMTMAPQRC
uniref:Uncharacterized protein n=1 Tax=Trypanosoma congolense (strain IL3000) TaxID=1068625 RepID=G0UQF0_TRYCI|nr:conserved hypothetical protein [Trypanosoma congolense IL3000]